MSVAARTGEGSRTALFALLGDERLARLTAAGHERAFGVVYERHHQAIYRYCRSILREDADAQDALQSTFAAAFAALRRGHPDAPIRPWLFRIAHNEAVSALRRRRPASDLSAALDSCTTSVEDQVAERVELETLLRDLRELNERQRSALVMRELSGLSHEEIAIALETSVGAAKQTIYEARRSLFEFAEGRAMTCDEIRRTISDADGRLMRSRRVRAHLLECAGCAAFAAAIPARTRELGALAPPLSAVAAAGLLGHIATAGPSHGAGSGLIGLAGGAAGKTAGAALAANALASAAVVATATVGVTIGVDKLAHPASHPRARPVVAPNRDSVPNRARTPVLAPSIAPPGTPSRGASSTRSQQTRHGHKGNLTRGSPGARAAAAALSIAAGSTAPTVLLTGTPSASPSSGGWMPGGRVTASPQMSSGSAGRAPASAGTPAQTSGGRPASTGAGTSTGKPAAAGSGQSSSIGSLPPGQAKKAGSSLAGSVPPGQAKKAGSSLAGSVPPGQAKKDASSPAGSAPPGQAKKDASSPAGSAPPGQAKKDASSPAGSAPPGQAKKDAASSGAVGTPAAAGVTQSSPSQASVPAGTAPATTAGPPAGATGAANSGGHGHGH